MFNTSTFNAELFNGNSAEVISVDTKRIIINEVPETTIINVDTRRIVVNRITTTVNVDVLRRLYKVFDDSIFENEYLQALKAILSLLQGGV